MRFAPLPEVYVSPIASHTRICCLTDTQRTETEEPEENQWDQVDDFKWLKAGHSPNWTTLSDNERLSDELWRDVVPGRAGVSVDEALKKLGIPRR
jgi:hypothetical protein